MKIVYIVLALFFIGNSVGYCMSDNIDATPSKPIRLSLRFNDMPEQKLRITYWDDIPKVIVALNDNQVQKFSEGKEVSIAHSNDTYTVQIKPNSSFVYIDVEIWQENMYKPLFRRYLTETGDEIQINLYNSTIASSFSSGIYGNYTAGQTYLRNHKVEFSGSGAVKYRVRYQADSLIKFDRAPSAIRYEQAINIITKNKAQIGSFFANVLSANLFCREQLDYIITAESYGWKYGMNEEKKNQPRNFDLSSLDKYPENVQLLSDLYSYLIYRRVKFDHIGSGGKSVSEIYPILSSQYKGWVREKLLCYYFMDNLTIAEGLDQQLAEAKNYALSEDGQRILDALSAHNVKGSIAYDFALSNEEGKIVKLSDFKDKIVFLDFWFTGCSGCSYLYQNTIKEVEEYFKGNKKVVFISVSIDKDFNHWKQSISSGLYTSDATINLYTNGLGLDHDVIRNYRIVQFPTIYLISEENKIFETQEALLRDRDTLISLIHQLLEE